MNDNKFSRIYVFFVNFDSKKVQLTVIHLGQPSRIEEKRVKMRKKNCHIVKITNLFAGKIIYERTCVRVCVF